MYSGMRSCVFRYERCLCIQVCEVKTAKGCIDGREALDALGSSVARHCIQTTTSPSLPLSEEGNSPKLTFSGKVTPKA